MKDDIDLTEEWCPDCGGTGNWVIAEQNEWSLYLQCAFCLCHIVLYQLDDGEILQRFEPEFELSSVSSSACSAAATSPSTKPDKLRRRLELHAPDEQTAERWTNFEKGCVQCGRTIHPFRQRAPGNARHLYLASTCPLTVSLPCSRGMAAREEYQRIYNAIPNRQ